LVGKKDAVRESVLKAHEKEETNSYRLKRCYKGESALAATRQVKKIKQKEVENGGRQLRCPTDESRDQKERGPMPGEKKKREKMRKGGKKV